MTTNTAIAKLRSALTCHPNAVRPLIEEAISALEAATALDAQGEAAWEGGEGWESLAWELCADEHGEEACNELIWEGGPIPEPWGDRWMKYEGEAKRLIALVHKHVPAAPPPPLEVQGEARPDVEHVLTKLGEFEVTCCISGIYKSRPMGLQKERNELHALIRALSSAPPPPEVGKPLSEEQIEVAYISAYRTLNHHHSIDYFRAGVRHAEKARGIVTKETGT